MTCPDPILKPNSYLAKYSVREYVAVCAKIFQTSDGAGSIPLNQEATRVDLLMKDITSDPAITWAWSGERLLISGVSHGATAPVIAMARNDFDESSKHWKGSKLTAACFFDGIYDTDSFLKLNSAAKDTTPVGNSCSMYERAYGRYCRWPKLSNPNRPETWPHPSLCKSPQLAADTIRGVSPSQFAIKQWKLIECGSALPFCDQDMVPAAPIRQFCRLLNADPDHSCEFASFPDKPHMICGADEATMESCREWFDGLQ